MAKIPGKLLVDMLPDSNVRLVFLHSNGDTNVSPVNAHDLDTAEVLFMTCGLSVGLAGALRAEVNRNKVASVDAVVDEDVAARFQPILPTN